MFSSDFMSFSPFPALGHAVSCGSCTRVRGGTHAIGLCLTAYMRLEVAGEKWHVFWVAFFNNELGTHCLAASDVAMGGRDTSQGGGNPHSSKAFRCLIWCLDTLIALT